MGNLFKECSNCVATCFCRMYKGERQIPDGVSYCSSRDRLYTALKLSRLPKSRYDNLIYNFKITESNKDIYDFILPNIEHIEEFVDKGMNAVLYGAANGTGKTYTACMLLNHYMVKASQRKDFDFETPIAMYISYPELMDTLRYEKFEDKTAGCINMIKQVPILLLDDVGASTISDYVLEQTYMIINARTELNKSTVITTNLKLPDLGNLLRDRIMSRILKDCIGKQFTSSVDMRKYVFKESPFSNSDK